MTTHRLVGVVTYYGKHYSTFFFHTKLQLWIYFDDASVSEVGPDWEHVVDKCRRGHFQPLLLLYADPEGTAVPTGTAPTAVTPVGATVKTCGRPQYGGSLPRSVTPNSLGLPLVGNNNAAGRRAITPNPEAYRDYQNITDLEGMFQQHPDEVFHPQEPVYIHRQTVESILRAQQQQQAISSSSSSSSDADSGIVNKIIPGSSLHNNQPRCRDSGNWSGDRNSASSSSSTSMENPYQYMINRNQR